MYRGGEMSLNYMTDQIAVMGEVYQTAVPYAHARRNRPVQSLHGFMLHQVSFLFSICTPIGQAT